MLDRRRPALCCPTVRTSRPGRAAFTLIELLVVIAIIIVLAGMIFTVGPAVIDRGNRVQAASDTAQIVTAVKSYYTDYGAYPLNKNQTGAPTVIRCSEIPARVTTMNCFSTRCAA